MTDGQSQTTAEEVVQVAAAQTTEALQAPRTYTPGRMAPKRRPTATLRLVPGAEALTLAFRPLSPAR